MQYRSPELFQKVVGTLFKYGDGAVALTSDFDQMFLQVKVKEDDINSLRFLYSDVENEKEGLLCTKTIETYLVLAVHRLVQTMH